MKLYVDMENGEIYTEKALRNEFEQSESDCRTFAEFLRNCSWFNNGTIAEIRTSETSKGDFSGSVRYCKVQDKSSVYYYCNWLTDEMIHDERNDGFSVQCIDVTKDCFIIEDTFDGYFVVELATIDHYHMVSTFNSLAAAQAFINEF